MTGSTDGLGRALAEKLATRGWRVLVHGRDPSRVEHSVTKIRRHALSKRDAPASGSAPLPSAGSSAPQVFGYVADFASLRAARNLAERVRAEHLRLDVLVNNAGVYEPRRSRSTDGIELTLAVNHLAHFALTMALLDLLKRSAPARIVNVASGLQHPPCFEDPNFEQRPYSGERAYGASKFAQVAFTIDLAARLAGSGVTVNALHPATLMPTKLALNTGLAPQSTIEQGVAATLRLVLDPSLADVSGAYFEGEERADPHPLTLDEKVRERIWELSERLTRDCKRATRLR